MQNRLRMSGLAMLGCIGYLVAVPAASLTSSVVLTRVPDGGIQPKAAVDPATGTVHLVYFRGEGSRGDAFYIHSRDGATFSPPVQVNSSGGTAIATGSVRGAQIAIGRHGRVHVSWNGSRPTQPGATPIFYSRLNDTGDGFEPQRNVMRGTYDLDGGGAVAADRAGNVYVVWHANAPGERDEARRRVWVTSSADDGATFRPEHAVFGEPAGACGCCGLGAFVDSRGSVFILFRSAFALVHRDMYLLVSHDGATSFTGTKIDEWNVGACVMSTQAFAEAPSAIYTAWETKGQVYMARIERTTGRIARVVAAPGVTDGTRKHPALATDGRGDVVLAWTEGTAWNKGGSVAWQVFDAAGTTIGEQGHAGNLPVWGLVAAYRQGDGRFAITY
jgi:hypothetical protein